MALVFRQRLDIFALYKSAIKLSLKPLNKDYDLERALRISS